MLEQRLRDLTFNTKFAKHKKGMFQNILMYGPPGTGKMLSAKQLAQHSGLVYAIMSGGGLASAGKDGIPALQKVLDWATTSRRGVLLFVDEADVLLRNQSSKTISKELRETLDTIIYITRDPSNKFMLVLASRTPEKFDWVDRFNVIYEFPLPGLDERERLVRLYFDKFIWQPAAVGKRCLQVAEFDHNMLYSEIAKTTEGMSGREIAKLSQALQNAAYASADGILTEGMIITKVQNAMIQHKKKVVFGENKP